MVNYFLGGPINIYTHKHLTHEYSYAQEFPGIRQFFESFSEQSELWATTHYVTFQEMK